MYIPIDWQISEDTVVQPDVLTVCKSVEEIRLMEAPEALFEILSPSTQNKDRAEKFELYQSQKVPYYTKVDPETETAEIFALDETGLYKKQEFDTSFTYRFGECEVILDFGLVWE